MESPEPANRHPDRRSFESSGCSAGLALRPTDAIETTELLLVASNSLGQCFDSSSQVADLRDESCHCPRIVTVRSVLFDHGAECLVTVETRAADASRGGNGGEFCLLYTSPSPRDSTRSRMPSSA